MKLQIPEIVTSTATSIAKLTAKLAVGAVNNTPKAVNHFQRLNTPAVTNYEVSATASIFLTAVFLLYLIENGKYTTFAILAGAAGAGVTGIQQYGGFEKALNYFKPAQPAIEPLPASENNLKKAN